MFEIKNGIVGINRSAMFHLINLIYFRVDELVQNLFGISGECLLWLNHPHYPFYRNPKPNLKKQIISNYQLEKVKINDASVVFASQSYGSVFLNVLVKEMILEGTVKMEFVKDPYIYIGISTPSQLNKAMLSYIGNHDCGAGFCFASYSSYIRCNGKYSYNIRESPLKNGENVIVIINQKNNNTSESGGKMNFFQCGKKVFHTITNIPRSGVHLGFSSYHSSFIVHITSLRKLRVLPPPSTTTVTTSPASNSAGVMKCVAYDFNGEFESCCYNHRDENGEEILNIQEYYREYYS